MTYLYLQIARSGFPEFCGIFLSLNFFTYATRTHKLCTLTHIFARMDTIESLCPSKFQSYLDRTSNTIYLTCLEAVEYNS